MNMTRIEIPYTDAGKRCVDVLSNLALRQLERARDAALSIIVEVMDDCHKVDERAMYNGKYSAVFASPCGARRKVVYDYRTKEIEMKEVAA